MCRYLAIRSCNHFLLISGLVSLAHMFHRFPIFLFRKMIILNGAQLDVVRTASEGLGCSVAYSVVPTTLNLNVSAEDTDRSARLAKCLREPFSTGGSARAYLILLCIAKRKKNVEHPNQLNRKVEDANSSSAKRADRRVIRRFKPAFLNCHENTGCKFLTNQLK